MISRRQALEMLAAHPVDVVMLDQRMPGEQGLDVLLQIKSLDPTIIVVLATAVREVKTAVEALKRGAYDYITKPFEVDDIVLLVQRALEKRTLEREVLCLRSELARPGLDPRRSHPPRRSRVAEHRRLLHGRRRRAHRTARARSDRHRLDQARSDRRRAHVAARRGGITRRR